MGVLTEPEEKVSPLNLRKKRIGVNKVVPGATQFTRIFWFSLAAVLDNPITAALLAQYAAFPGAPNWPKTLAAVTYYHVSTYLSTISVDGKPTMLPPSVMAFNCALKQLKTPFALTAN